MPPTPPPGGFGPANYQYQGAPEDPMSQGFNSQLSYQDMMRFQMISQYQNRTPDQITPQMGMNQQRMIATDPRFQYGLSEGQDTRMYARQAEMSRMAYSGAFANLLPNIAMWSGAEMLSKAGLATLGMRGIGAGILGSFALPMAMTAFPAYHINKGVQDTMQRQRMMHSVASDVEAYGAQLGMGGISYNQASVLGADLTNTMTQPGQFFNPEQMMRIHKIGVANNMISGRGGSGTNSSIQQYSKNFKELVSTTEEIVKMLNTTIEGGMSVINELRGAGFGNIRQIKAQVQQAKAFGTVTGLGSQNMMLIGAAGAQAAQGTPWAPATAANMYQTAAASASVLAQGSPAMANAVQRVGGIAAAGSIMANATMNMMSSGYGVKMAAYMMKPDGSVDQGRMDRLLGGGVSPYEITTQANALGYAMGTNRVMFNRFRYDMFNNMDPNKQRLLQQQTFNAWRSGKGGNLEQQAWVYAGKYANTMPEQEFLYQSFIAPSAGMVQLNAAQMAAKGVSNFDQNVGTPIIKSILNDVYRRSGLSAVGGGLQAFGAGTTMAMTGITTQTSEWARRTYEGFTFKTAEWALRNGVITPGQMPAINYGIDPTTAYSRMYGLNKPLNYDVGVESLRSNPRRMAMLTGRSDIKTGVNVELAMQNWSKQDLQYVNQSLTQIMTTRDTSIQGKMFQDSRLKELLPGMNTQASAFDMASTLANKIQRKINSTSSELDNTISEFSKNHKNEFERNRMLNQANKDFNTALGSGRTIQDYLLGPGSEDTKAARKIIALRSQNERNQGMAPIFGLGTNVAKAQSMLSASVSDIGGDKANYLGIAAGSIKGAVIGGLLLPGGGNIAGGIIGGVAGWDPRIIPKERQMLNRMLKAGGTSIDKLGGTQQALEFVRGIETRGSSYKETLTTEEQKIFTAGGTEGTNFFNSMRYKNYTAAQRTFAASEVAQNLQATAGSIKQSMIAKGIKDPNILSSVDSVFNPATDAKTAVGLMNKYSSQWGGEGVFADRYKNMSSISEVWAGISGSMKERSAYNTDRDVIKRQLLLKTESALGTPEVKRSDGTIEKKAVEGKMSKEAMNEINALKIRYDLLTPDTSQANQSRAVAATVSPPVLNMWNNKWS